MWLTRMVHTMGQNLISNSTPCQHFIRSFSVDHEPAEVFLIGFLQRNEKQGGKAETGEKGLIQFFHFPSQLSSSALPFIPPIPQYRPPSCLLGWDGRVASLCSKESHHRRPDLWPSNLCPQVSNQPSPQQQLAQPARKADHSGYYPPFQKLFSLHRISYDSKAPPQTKAFSYSKVHSCLASGDGAAAGGSTQGNLFM